MKQISYKKLEKDALILANYLHEKVNPGDLIGIMLPKCWQQICSAIGILAAGGVYLPIDVSLPKNRKDMILKQNNIKYVVTDAEHGFSEDCIDIDELLGDGRVLETKALPTISTSLNDLAYVILTSGTTGIPKGVMIEHASAVNTIQDINYRFNVNKEDSVLALSNLSFDLSVYDIFGLLAVGGKVVLPRDSERREPKRWLDYLNELQITIWNTVPMFMQLLVEHLQSLDQSDYAGSLRLIMMSGDKIPTTLPKQIINHLQNPEPDIRIISLGGATEGSIWSIIYENRSQYFL